jgi:hypothetical protein
MPLAVRIAAALAVLAPLVAAPACYEPGDPGMEASRDRDPVEVRFEEYGVVIDNYTGAPVYFNVYRPGALALFTVCTDPIRCTSVPARSSRAVPFAEITAWDADASSVEVDYWHLVSDGEGGYRPDGRGKVLATR